MTTPRDKVTRMSRTVCWVPPGRHVDIFSGLVYDGDRQVSFHRGLDQYAILAQSGAIVPFDASEAPANGCPNPKALEVKVVVGRDGHFKMYEDDGHGSGLASVNLICTPMKWEQGKALLTIGPATASDPSIPSKRDWTVTFIGFPHAHGHTIRTSLGDDEEPKCLIEYQPHGISVTVANIHTTSRVEISLGVENPQLELNDPLKRAFPIVDQAQMAYDSKNKIWNILKNDRSLSVKVGDLMALDVPISIKEAVSEVLLADGRVYS